MTVSVITFDESLTVYNVAQECERLKQLVSPDAAKIVLDIGALQELDGAGFQLILSLVKLRPQQCVISSLPTQGCASWLTAQLQQHGVNVEGQ